MLEKFDLLTASTAILGGSLLWKLAKSKAFEGIQLEIKYKGKTILVLSIGESEPTAHNIIDDSDETAALREHNVTTTPEQEATHFPVTQPKAQQIKPVSKKVPKNAYRQKP